MKRLILLLCLLLVPAVVHASQPEVPADGIDDPLQTGGSANGTKGSCPGGYMDSIIGNGCDKIAPGVDGDDDGYTSDGTLGTANTTYIDCDSADKTIYPGVYTAKGCSAGQYHKCQNDGTYTGCTATTLAEGSHANYYIDCSAGNDSNAGTHASPFKTWGKVSGGSSAGGLPASPVTLQGDDAVYLQGTATCSDTITGSGYANGITAAVIGEFDTSGTSGHPIMLRMYPGSTAKIANTNGPGFIGDGSFIDVRGSGLALWDFSTQRSSAANATSIMFSSSSTHNLDGIYIHGDAMQGDNNDACIYFPHTNGGVVTHFYLYNCKGNTGNPDNIGGITWLDDHGNVAECQNHEAGWGTVWWDAEDNTNGGNCFKQKHGCNASDVGTNKHRIHNTTCINARHGIHWEGSSLRYTQSVMIGTPMILYMIAAGGADDSNHEDNELTNVMFYKDTLLDWGIPTFLTTSQHLKIDSDVFVDSFMSSYTVNDGLIAIAAYGNDAHFATFEANSELASDYNCFYNPATAVKINYFGQDHTSSGWDGTAGDTGGLYSVSSWKGLTPADDAHSYEENPAVDGNLLPTSTHCSTIGRSYTGAGAATSSNGMMCEFQ